MIKNFRELLNDRRRIEAFKSAIDELIRPDSIVTEIGTALGTYSYFSAMAKAAKIYAIEMDTIFDVGKEIARRNQFSNKISFIHDKSTNVQLPERSDFIIMEDYGPFFLYDNLEQTIVDARTRFLKSGGRFIPNNILLKIAPVECPQIYQSLHLWETLNDRLYGIDWSYTTQLVMNCPHYAENYPKSLLAKESQIKEIELSTDVHFPYDFSTKLEIQTSGTIHGLLGWWDCWFTPTQFFSNSPNAPTNTWGQMFFPFLYPVAVQKGEIIQIGISAIESKLSQRIHYKWMLETSSVAQEQNTFQGTPFLPENASDIVHEATPVLTTDGKIIQFILSQINGKTEWREIAERLVAKFPEHCVDIDKALQKIGEISKSWYAGH